MLEMVAEKEIPHGWLVDLLSLAAEQGGAKEFAEVLMVVQKDRSGPEGRVQWSRRTGLVQKDGSSGPEGRVWSRRTGPEGRWDSRVLLGGMAKMPLEVAVAPGLWLIRFVCE